MAGQKKILLALDFDNTIIDDNSDTAIDILAPNSIIPHEIRKSYSLTGWTSYMQKVFNYLFQNGVSKDNILNEMNKIPLCKGMNDLFHIIPKDKTEIIIISDSNTIFISHILNHQGIKNYIDEIFTNPAEFDKNGCISISMYQEQHWCDLSSINLCKGQILCDYIEKRKHQGIEFGIIAYVGDGINDLCPGLCLRETDLLFPRYNYPLHKKIQNMSIGEATCPKSTIHTWTSADEIVKRLKPLYEKLSTITVPSPRLVQPKLLFKMT